jgi:hypothetical protein
VCCSYGWTVVALIRFRTKVPEYPEYIVPHADHGDPECCGLIFPVLRGNSADLVCNECGVIVRMVPASDADRVVSEMTLDQEFATEICPHCRQVNILPGLTEMILFTCRYCGGVVDPSVHCILQLPAICHTLPCRNARPITDPRRRQPTSP